jgi:hypothetical protein
MEVIGEIDEMIEWLSEVESKISDEENKRYEKGVIRVKMKEKKEMNDDI